MKPKVTSIPSDQPTFSGFNRCENLTNLDADIAVVGVPFISPTPMSLPVDMDLGGYADPHMMGPSAIRKHSERYAHSVGHYEFEFDGDLFDGRDVRVTDCGDVDIVPGDHAWNLENVKAAVQTIVAKGTVPIILGGDHGATIPILWAFEKQQPLCVIHIDAHIDFIDERKGFRECGSSCMRRASEMPWVSKVMHIGTRGVGSARQEELDADRAAGCIIVRGEELYQQGIGRALEQLPQSERYYITVDADALDPSIAPAVFYPTAGGLSYFDFTSLIKGIAGRGKIVGFDFVGIIPPLDVQGLTSILTGRLILNLIASLAYEGQVGR